MPDPVVHAATAGPVADPVADPIADAAVDALVAREIDLARRQAALDAERTALYAAVHDHAARIPSPTDADGPLNSLAAELGLATRVSDRTIRSRIAHARTLRDDYPTTLEHLATGRIQLAHARVIADAGLPLDASLRAEYERVVLPHAHERTPGRLRPIAERIAADLDPAGTGTAHATAHRHRDVTLRDLGRGMTALIAELPAVQAHAIHDRLTQLARADQRDRADRADRAATGAPVPYEGAFGRAVHDPDAAPTDRSGTTAPGTAPVDAAPVDDRRFGEVRADALVELLLAGRVDSTSRHAAINAIQARVAITIPALALTGTHPAPAVLDGVGPIPLDTALRLAAGANQWIRLLTDPVTGTPLAADTYRPGAALRRFLEHRDTTCRMPGCGTPARDGDLDHTRAWADGGRTTPDNLAVLCRYHHTLKHSGWHLEQPAPGELVWTAPSGRRYRQRPEPVARPHHDRPSRPPREPTPSDTLRTALRAHATAATATTPAGHRPRPEFRPTVPAADDPAQPAPTGPRTWRHAHWTEIQHPATATTAPAPGTTDHATGAAEHPPF